MKVVVALGGNALLRRGEPQTLEALAANAAVAARGIAGLARHHDVVVTHGNGPQVGLLALQAEAFTEGPRVPLDVLGAESEGMIGYLLEREVASLLPERPSVALLTQTVVDPTDPAFDRPTKPIGPVYAEAEGAALAAAHGWAMRPDGEGVRRVVASPAPQSIVELAAIRILVDHGVLVICTGGGGVPVARRPDGRLQGVEAVVDKDAASAVLATELGADTLLLLTDVEAVYRDWPDRQDPIRTVSADAIGTRALDAGSMGPKVAAACAFARGGGRACIGALHQAPEVLAGTAGTTITPSPGAS